MKGCIEGGVEDGTIIYSILRAFGLLAEHFQQCTARSVFFLGILREDWYSQESFMRKMNKIMQFHFQV